jgi:hypothetical protein
MKNIGLILIMILVPFSSKAQSEKGTFQVGLGGLPIIYPDNSSESGYSLRGTYWLFPNKQIIRRTSCHLPEKFRI